MIARARWAVTRALLVLGVLHVVNGVVAWQLWRHRRTVLRLLAGAIRDELAASGPAAGEGAAGLIPSSAVDAFRATGYRPVVM